MINGIKRVVPKCMLNAIYIHKETIRFERDFTAKSSMALENAYRDLVSWITDIEVAIETNRFPRDTHHCEDYGGCEFKCLKDVNDDKFFNRVVGSQFNVIERPSRDDCANFVDGAPKQYYSYTKVSTFMTCPRKFYFRYILRLQPKEKALPLSAGYIISRGLDAYRASGTLDDTLRAMVDAAKEPDIFIHAKSVDDPIRSLERLMEIMAAYCKHYPDERSHIIQPEVTFEVPIDKEGVRIFNGRIDGIYRLDDGTPGLIEDKTATRLGEFFFKQHKAAPQISWYLWAANQLGLFEV